MDSKAAKSRKELVSFFTFGGIILLIFGGVQLFSYLGSGSRISFSDACFNGLAGILSLIGSWLASRGKIIVVLVVVFYVIAGLIYAFAVGRGFNYFIILFAVILFPWIYYLRKNGGLS